MKPNVEQMIQQHAESQLQTNFRTRRFINYYLLILALSVPLVNWASAILCLIGTSQKSETVLWIATALTSFVAVLTSCSTTCVLFSMMLAQDNSDIIDGKFKDTRIFVRGDNAEDKEHEEEEQKTLV